MNEVWTAVRSGCSLFLASPASKQNPDLALHSAFSVVSGRSSRPPWNWGAIQYT